MKRVPKRLKVEGPEAQFLQWLNDLRDCVEEQRQTAGPQQLVSVTTKGTIVRPNVAAQPGVGGDDGVWL